ncbi:MAG: hypothetical protein ABIN01_11110 [Ferruginibacter sp.]
MEFITTEKKSAGKYVPIIFFEIYLTFTVLLFFYGPWDWGIDNGPILLLYLMGSQLALLLGYISGIRHLKPNIATRAPITLIKISILLNLLIALPLIYVRSGGNYSFIIKGFTDPGLVYDLSRDAKLSYDITEYVNIIVSPLTWSLVPWTIYYWKALEKKIKIIAILGIIWGTVIPYAASGTNKGLFDIFFILFGLIGLPFFIKHKFKYFFKSRFLKYFIIMISFFIALTYYFTKNISQRLGENDFMEQISLNTRANNATVSDKFLQSNFPESMKGGTIALTSYLSQGYYGCSLALKEKFVPTFGLGNSRFLSWLVGDLVLGRDFQKDTYVRRVSKKTGWDADITWSSIYPWFASDFTFLGTYLIIFLVGNLLAKSWFKMISYSNPWAIVLFSLLCIMIFYFSANNQIFQTGTTFVTFFAALFLWRYRFKF